MVPAVVVVHLLVLWLGITIDRHIFSYRVLDVVVYMETWYTKVLVVVVDSLVLLCVSIGIAMTILWCVVVDAIIRMIPYY